MKFSLPMIVVALAMTPRLASQEVAVAGVVTGGTLTADLTQDPPVVEVSYRLRSVPESRILGVQVLPAGDVEIGEVRVRVGGLERGAVRMTATPTGLLRSGVALGPRPDDEVDLDVVLQYELPAAPPMPGPAFIPVVVAGAGAEEPRNDFFVVDVRVPASPGVRGGFPEGYRVETDSAGARFRASMKVIPAFVRVDTGDGVSPAWVAEILVPVLLLALGWMAWKAFVRSAFEPEVGEGVVDG